MNEKKTIHIDALSFKDKLRKNYNEKYAADEKQLDEDIKKAKKFWYKRWKEKGIINNKDNA